MRDQSQPIVARGRRRVLLSVVVILLGLTVVGFFGLRAVASFRQFEYIRQQGLDRGTANVNAVRPWMTIRFVAVAYAVPEEYLYSQLNIPFDRRNADHPLGQLNREYELGFSPTGELAIIEQTRNAITAYRADPVATGLRDVRPWMSVRYIANSTGVSEQRIFATLGIPATGNENKPLDLLSRDVRYEGGPRALAEAVDRALAAQQGQP